MSQQVNAIQLQSDKNTQIDSSNRFSVCEQIVDELVEQGLPSSFVPERFISKISKTYDVSLQEARTCLKLAIKQLETNDKPVEKKQEDKLYAQSGYFYPASFGETSYFTKPKDGMDSLASLGGYNKLMFGIK